MATQRIRTDACTGDELARAFKWLTRSGVGVRRSTERPIGWYQAHQLCALDVLTERMGGHGALRFSAGIVYGKRDGADRWAVLGTADELFQEADRRARQ